jgi:hypothetical protein
MIPFLKIRAGNRESVEETVLHEASDIAEVVCFDRADLVSKSNDFRWDPDDFDFLDYPVGPFLAGFPIFSSLFKIFTVRRGRFGGLFELFSMDQDDEAVEDDQNDEAVDQDDD